MAEDINKEGNEEQDKSIFNRYLLLTAVLLLAACWIVVKMCITMFVEKDQWTTMAKELVRPTTTILPSRGNIYSNNMKLMATSVPRYYTYIDFKSDALQVDSFLYSKRNGVDSLSICLSIKSLLQYLVVVAPDVDDILPFRVFLAVKGDSDRHVILGPFDFFITLFDWEVFHIGINRRYQAGINALGCRLVSRLKVIIESQDLALGRRIGREDFDAFRNGYDLDDRRPFSPFRKGYRAAVESPVGQDGEIGIEISPGHTEIDRLIRRERAFGDFIDRLVVVKSTGRNCQCRP